MMTRHPILRPARLARLALVGLMLAPMLAATTLAQETPAPEGTPDNGLTYEQASQRLDRLITQAERVRGQLDRTQLDVAALSAGIGVDPVAIVGHVTREIAFEQYAGVLRGAEGTLRARAGNAHDTALLLTALLATAGYEVEVALGELPPEQAARLVAQMAAPRMPEPPIGNVDAIVALLTQVGRTAGVPADELAASIDAVVSPPGIEEDAAYAAVVEGAAALGDTLREAGVPLGDPDLVAALAVEASAYAWVRYRKDAEQAWVEAHPAFKDGAAPVDVVATGSLVPTDGIPPELLHRVRIDVTLERNLGGVLETQPLTESYDQAAMDADLTALTLDVQSNAVYKIADPEDAGEIVAGTDLFLVSFQSAAPDATSTVFGLDGGLYTLRELPSGEFGVEPKTGEVISNSLSDAADAIGAMGEEAVETPVPVASALTAVWVDYTLVAPGGDETSVRRTLVDRIGPARRTAGEVDPADADDHQAVTTALLRKGTLMVGTGAVPQVLVVDAALRYIVSTAPGLHAALREQYALDGQAGGSGQMAVEPGWPGLLPLLATFDRLATADPGVVAYRDRPSIVTYRESITREAAASDRWVVATAIDVVGNQRRVVSVADGVVAPAADAALLVGVWETHAEEGANPNPYELPQRNTMRSLEDAEAAGVPLAVVRDAADLGRLELDPDILATLALDLERGFVVVVPASSEEPGGRTGWWRVNPLTGETLGMTSDGGGQSAMEYSLLLSVACAGYAGFTGWGPLTTLANCGGLVGGYGVAVAGGSALVGVLIAAFFLVLGNELGNARY